MSENVFQNGCDDFRVIFTLFGNSTERNDLCCALWHLARQRRDIRLVLRKRESTRVDEVQVWHEHGAALTWIKPTNKWQINGSILLQLSFHIFSQATPAFIYIFRHLLPFFLSFITYWLRSMTQRLSQILWPVNAYPDYLFLCELSASNITL